MPLDLDRLLVDCLLGLTRAVAPAAGDSQSLEKKKLRSRGALASMLYSPICTAILRFGEFLERPGRLPALELAAELLEQLCRSDYVDALLEDLACSAEAAGGAARSTRVVTLAAVFAKCIALYPVPMFRLYALSAFKRLQNALSSPTRAGYNADVAEAVTGSLPVSAGRTPP